MSSEKQGCSVLPGSPFSVSCGPLCLEMETAETEAVEFVELLSGQGRDWRVVPSLVLRVPHDFNRGDPGPISRLFFRSPCLLGDGPCRACSVHFPTELGSHWSSVHLVWGTRQSTGRNIRGFCSAREGREK